MILLGGAFVAGGSCLASLRLRPALTWSFTTHSAHLKFHINKFSLFINLILFLFADIFTIVLFTQHFLNLFWSIHNAIITPELVFVVSRNLYSKMSHWGRPDYKHFWKVRLLHWIDFILVYWPTGNVHMISSRCVHSHKTQLFWYITIKLSFNRPQMYKVVVVSLAAVLVFLNTCKLNFQQIFCSAYQV